MNTKELKQAVDEYIRVNRKYYSAKGDVDLLPKITETLMRVRGMNEKVYYVLSNSTIFYTSLMHVTNKQIYHIIDYLCKTNLENEEDK